MDRIQEGQQASEVILQNIQSENQRLLQAKNKSNLGNILHDPNNFLRTTFTRKHKAVYSMPTSGMNWSVRELGNMLEAFNMGHLEENEENFKETLSGIVNMLKAGPEGRVGGSSMMVRTESLTGSMWSI
jgi:hypothetical protein